MGVIVLVYICDTDTRRTEYVTVERVAGSGIFEQVPNPLSVEQLIELVRAIDHKKNNKKISITGGAPLLQAKFLQSLMPRLAEDGHALYLETAGDLPQQLESLIEWVDVAAMDVKLSSVTEEKIAFQRIGSF